MRRSFAARYGGPDVLTLALDCPIPKPRGNQLLIRVAASSVNPIDRWMMRGYGRHLFPLVGVEPPFTLGRDVVGEVVGLGPLAWGFAKGQMVVAATHPTADGSHADYTVVAETATALLPPGVTVERAAALPFAALTAWRALNGLARVQSGQTVVVHGAAGSVGSFATQYLANHVGCRVIGTCRPDKISQLQQQCSQATFLSVDDFLAASADATAGSPQQHDLACDVVLDGLGRGVADGAVQRQSLAVLREGGHLLDLNGQLIRAIDGLGDVASCVESPSPDQIAARPGSGTNGGPIEFNFASQFKATAKAAAELAGLHTPGSHTRAVPAHLSSMLAASHRYHYVLFQEDGEALATCLSLLDQGVVDLPARTEYTLEELPEAFATEVSKAIVTM